MVVAVHQDHASTQVHDLALLVREPDRHLAPGLAQRHGDAIAERLDLAGGQVLDLDDATAGHGIAALLLHEGLAGGSTARQGGDGAKQNGLGDTILDKCALTNLSDSSRADVGCRRGSFFLSPS